MTKREVIKATHVRNEQFVREFKSIIELLPLICSWKAIRIQVLSGEQPLASQVEWEMLRMEAALEKVVMDRLDALLENWPNAVWLFFPGAGHTGWIRLFNEFHSKIFPSYFPEAPQRILWRTKRVRGHRSCGIARRIRMESMRTFRIWDQFKAGGHPMDIVRREFPSRSVDANQKSKKELMAVHRSLERAYQLIYEQPMPTNRRMRRLLGYNYADHIATCVECRIAENVNEFCQQTQDFVNQDQKI
jgi:hypothetical protein